MFNSLRLHASFLLSALAMHIWEFLGALHAHLFQGGHHLGQISQTFLLGVSCLCAAVVPVERILQADLLGIYFSSSLFAMWPEGFLLPPCPNPITFGLKNSSILSLSRRFFPSCKWGSRGLGGEGGVRGNGPGLLVEARGATLKCHSLGEPPSCWVICSN